MLDFEMPIREQPGSEAEIQTETLSKAIEPLMGPSKSQGAVMRSWRSAAKKVVVFQ
jgi:hypothetical protein